MIEQEHKREYRSGYLRPDGLFVENAWAHKWPSRDEAITVAKEYANQGNETLAWFGADAQLRPAIILRKVYYDESEPEVVG